MEKIFKKITTITAINYIVLIIIFLIIFLIKDNGERFASRVLSTNVLLGSTIFSIALPILFRTGFYNKSYKNKKLKKNEYFVMKLLIIISVFIGSLFALYAYYFPILKYHLYLSFLFGLWGLYSVIPSKRIYEKDIITYMVEK